MAFVDVFPFHGGSYPPPETTGGPVPVFALILDWYPAILLINQIDVYLEGLLCFFILGFVEIPILRI